jgi:cell wall assembly regulator SMI1
VSAQVFEETLRRLERTLIHEGGPAWRKTLLEGEAAQFTWPEDLPPLTPDLKVWFAWRSASDDGSAPDSWRSAAWAAAQYRLHSAKPAFRKSLVPVLGQQFVDVEDGSVWIHHVDASGSDRFDRAPFANLSDLLSSIESDYAARRQSPWRRFRFDRAEGAWVHLDAVPQVGDLARRPVGAALFAGPAAGRLPRGQLLVKIAHGMWMMTSFRAPVPFVDSCIDLAIELLRYDCAVGNDNDALEADLSDEEIAKDLASMVKRWSARGPVELRSGMIRVWQQPSMSELLARLDRELARVAPGVRSSLAPPALETDVAALEADLRAPIPRDLRALWAFADGQTTNDCLYWGKRLVNVAHARRTISMMLGLAKYQFGAAYWDAGLVPLLDAFTGDFLCVDVNGAYGPEGCIVDFDHAQPERRVVLFGSVTQWLECFVDGLERGVYVVDPGRGIYPRDFLATGSLDEITRHNEVRTNGRYPWERRVALRSTTALR